MDKDTKIVLKALETLRNELGDLACGNGVTRLYNTGAWPLYENPTRPDFVEWLGMALAKAKCIEPPIIAPKDREYEGADTTIDGLERWYYPYDVLIHGCKLWNKRKRK